MLRLELLAKDASSGDKGCPGVHVDLDSADMLVTGHHVDSTQVENVLPGEGVVRIKPEILIEALARYQAR